jgi:hypothetical protein
MINSFPGYGCDRDVGATNVKLLALSGVALAASNMGLFDRAGSATVAVTADPPTAAARSIKRKKFPSFSNNIFKPGTYCRPRLQACA